jgi:hypothetical protein
MLPLTQIPDTDLWIIEVPKESKVEINNEYINNIGYCIGISNIAGKYSNGLIVDDKFELIGTISETEIDFDADSIVLDYVYDKYCENKYQDYCENYCQGHCYNGIDYNKEMYAFLLANGYCWQNPLEKPRFPKMDDYQNVKDNLKEQWRTYETAESKKLTGKIIVLKLLK